MVDVKKRHVAPNLCFLRPGCDSCTKGKSSPPTQIQVLIPESLGVNRMPLLQVNSDAAKGAARRNCVFEVSEQTAVTVTLNADTHKKKFEPKDLNRGRTDEKVPSVSVTEENKRRKIKEMSKMEVFNMKI